MTLRVQILYAGAKKPSGFNATDSQQASQPAPQLTDTPASVSDTEQQQQLRVRLDPQPLQPETAAASSLPGGRSSSGGSGGGGGGGGGTESGGLPLGLKIAWRRLLKEVASLPLAIALMATIAGLSGLGTLIPQNKVQALGRQFECE